jgi:hypothetical protein
MSLNDPVLGTYNAWRGDEVLAMAEPTLYHAPDDYGSSVARLALQEQGVSFRSRLVETHGGVAVVVEQARLITAFAAPPSRRSLSPLTLTLRWSRGCWSSPLASCPPSCAPSSNASKRRLLVKAQS